MSVGTTNGTFVSHLRYNSVNHSKANSRISSIEAGRKLVIKHNTTKRTNISQDTKMPSVVLEAMDVQKKERHSAY